MDVQQMYEQICEPKWRLQRLNHPILERLPNKTSPKSSAFVPLEPKHQSFPANITPFHRFFPNVLEKMDPTEPWTLRCIRRAAPLGCSCKWPNPGEFRRSEWSSQNRSGEKKLGVFFCGNPQLLTASNWGLIRNTSNGEENGNLYCFCRQKAATFIIWKAQGSTQKDKEMYSKLWKNVLATMTNVVMW